MEAAFSEGKHWQAPPRPARLPGPQPHHGPRYRTEGAEGEGEEEHRWGREEGGWSVDAGRQLWLKLGGVISLALVFLKMPS